ncbi:large subunit ribosomal protein L15 [Bathymodiolus platifrons methanotrophic gill symbiont]|uniref:50S ribosomal protein L15 n=1 Tax=Bathymodiolus platifrons methanotrophic gill symbiont TaxID=113268 RepID=UPI000B4148F4|nr:50S ribosomal protein L15 [Bathymodiolus platifrons methanotrophic gill symbiont]MCK5869095.1 50S ribosomal protein L15 [Methyloprofundus sp.]TXK97432.1 50S ribosomal protein L15 [Methylococcaceae bacterium CS4]TXK99718.1 50S ribosomal protein L15 [Methylococcaceae bacterium CS5]TXL01805.1 50S ribosomal protein L15 [Methylococcaceae bacterium HT1]TXL06602.1 50S ribosomal protein L15 [Methylococcaceae bacterium CS1]TXL09543.1 50S ribosomal protein L15 [Methylococcaceae bacterium CS3]TXL121
MYLNTIKPAEGSKKDRKRVGRGIGSTLGKTCGRGHKGQKSRSGGMPKVGFEGGQMPLQKRLPKVGFRSRKAKFTSEVRLCEIAKLGQEVVTLDDLIKANIVPAFTKVAKLIKSGEITTAVTLKGIKATTGAKASVEAAGGKVEE